MTCPKKGTGVKKKSYSERNHMNIKKGETSDSSFERRRDSRRHRTVSTSSSISGLKQAESMEIISLIIKLKENVLGNKISKVTTCLWLSKNYKVQDEMKIMARGDILVNITNKMTSMI